MARLTSSKNSSTIVSVSAGSPRSENNISLRNLSDTEFNRPVHRVDGRVPNRKPVRSDRSTVCPFRFRLAWWSKPEPPKCFENLCENCTAAKRGNKLETLFGHEHNVFRQQYLTGEFYSFLIFIEMAVVTNIQHWNQIPWDTNAWNWNVKLDNTLKTHVNIIWGFVLDMLFYNTLTTLDQGKTMFTYSRGQIE